MEPQDAAARHLSALDRLDLGLLPDDGLTFDEALPILWLQTEVFSQDPSGLTLTAKQDGRVHMTVVPVGAMETRPPIMIRGGITACAETACVRCLADVTVQLEAEVDTTVMFESAPKPKIPEAEELKGKKKRKKKKADDELEDWDETMLEPGALDDGSYTVEGLDLPSIVRETMLLGLHMNPTCDDEPACDQRTQALLDEANRAARELETATDPRWAALEALRNED